MTIPQQNTPTSTSIALVL